MKFTSTLHPISWFREHYMNGGLAIKPPFQRRPVWTPKQKCYLIETILLDFPIPEIYVQRSVTAEGVEAFAIVDGQQRIRSVLQFIGSESDEEEREFNGFVLDKLESTSSWSGFSFADLSDEQKKAFYSYLFTVRYLDTESDDDTKDVFRRLNKYLTPLKPQELRNATYSGPFAKLAEKLADDEYWAENRIITPASIRRQGDVEFVSELMIGTLHGPQGGAPGIIDRYYAMYEDYEDEFPEQRALTAAFQRTLDTVRDILPNLKDLRWGNKTDFYTMFVAFAHVFRKERPKRREKNGLRRALTDFASEIDEKRADENARVSEEAASYVRNVRGGANEKARRAARHEALGTVVGRELGRERGEGLGVVAPRRRSGGDRATTGVVGAG